MAGIFAWQRAVRDSASLGATAKLVGLTLSTWMDARGVCYPSEATIARAVGRSESTVRRALRELERAGFLVTRRRKNASNRYRGVKP